MKTEPNHTRKEKKKARVDGRAAPDLRPLKLTRGYLAHAEGSCLVQNGGTHVLCAATVEERVPAFLKGKGQGWVTAEYAMLPRSSTERVARDAYRGGRSLEISRLIGRSLRAVTNLSSFGERTITLDCDVLEADGGTRTAAINGAFVALHDALFSIANRGGLLSPPLVDQVVAVSVGKVAGEILLDLCYLEDSTAEADLNVVMTGGGNFVEIQGTAEQGTFSRSELLELLRVAERGLKRVLKVQAKTISDTALFGRPLRPVKG